MFRVTLLIWLLALGCTQVAADATVAPPEGAFVLKNPNSDEAQISWLPPAEGPADKYRVYGVNGAGNSVLLVETSQHAISVSSEYGGYEVTAVRDEVESAPARTVCVATQASPPFVSPRLDGNC